MEIVEATARNRTADILITSEVLYQLSYGGISSEIKELHERHWGQEHHL